MPDKPRLAVVDPRDRGAGGRPEKLCQLENNKRLPEADARNTCHVLVISPVLQLARWSPSYETYIRVFRYFIQLFRLAVNVM